MTFRLLPLSALLLAFLGGCAARVPPPAAPVVLPTIAGRFERRLADGAWTVAANLKNGSAAPVTVKVVCQFLGGNGQPLAEPAETQTVTVVAGGTETVRFTAADLAAAGETFSVRPR